jgi:uncharacterized protein YndB with AHSA1/START domain
MSETDKIEKTIVLRAPRSRVWRAISDAREFGTWFRVELEGPFVVGQVARGNIKYPGYEHVKFVAHIDAIEPEHRMVMRWHPNAIDPDTDYAAEPMTTVVFRLEDVPEGTRLTVTETGFDALPPERRDVAFRSNAGGWAEQLTNVERYLAG